MKFSTVVKTSVITTSLVSAIDTENEDLQERGLLDFLLGDTATTTTPAVDVAAAIPATPTPSEYDVE